MDILFLHVVYNMICIDKSSHFGLQFFDMEVGGSESIDETTPACESIPIETTEENLGCGFCQLIGEEIFGEKGLACSEQHIRGSASSGEVALVDLADGVVSRQNRPHLSGGQYVQSRHDRGHEIGAESLLVQRSAHQSRKALGAHLAILTQFEQVRLVYHQIFESLYITRQSAQS